MNSFTEDLKKKVDTERAVDIGSGAERLLNVSHKKLRSSVAELVEHGYRVETMYITRLAGIKKKAIKVLVAPFNI